MLDISFTTFPTLRTPRLTLREIVPEDAEALFRIRSDERVMRHILRPRQQDVSEAAQLIEVMRNAYAQNDSVVWGLSLHGQPDLIGNIVLWNIDKANHRAETGYLLHPDYWRQGLMDEAMTAVLEYGFRALNFHTIEAHTEAENEASGRLLLKHGFVQEAWFRENVLFEGRFHDMKVFGKINPWH